MIETPSEHYTESDFPACAAALRAGIDVTLLERARHLTPLERVARLHARLDLVRSIQQRTLSAKERAAVAPADDRQFDAVQAW